MIYILLAALTRLTSVMDRETDRETAITSPVYNTAQKCHICGSVSPTLDRIPSEPKLLNFFKIRCGLETTET